MALADVFQLICRTVLFGQDIDNVFFFSRQGTGGNAADLRDAFFSTLTIPIRHLQSAAVTWKSIDTINLGNESDFEKFPFVVGGLAGAGDTLPPHDAVGYTLNPATRAVRPGSKRFAGILEAVVENGVFTEPTYVSNIEALRILLDDPLVGATDTYNPVIVKRIKTPNVGTVPLTYKYALPKTGDPVVLGLIKSAYANPNVTTQNSRKR